jgi:predicted enzyme related to lactoylglutathione lyase
MPSFALASTRTAPPLATIFGCLTAAVIAITANAVRAQATTPLPPTSADAPLSSLKMVGVRVNVPDMKRALDFYVGVLNLEHLADKSNGKFARLRTKNEKLVLLVESAQVRPFASAEAHPMLTFQVNDLVEARRKLLQNNVSLADAGPRMEGVGVALTLRDPFGTLISMMQLSSAAAKPFDEPRMYNTGLMIPSMAQERALFAQLGLVELTTRFLPIDLPLGFPDKRFAFMLHERNWIAQSTDRTPENAPMTLVLSADATSAQATIWQRMGVVLQPSDLLGTYGPSRYFRTAGGIAMQVVN